MVLPQKEDIQNLDWTYMGKPFMQTQGKDTVETQNLDWTYMGKPFSPNSAPTIVVVISTQVQLPP